VNILIFVVLAFLVLNPLKKFQASIKKDEKLKPVGSSEFRKLAMAYNEIYDMKAKTERHLLIKAEYDALTGILNRRAFDQICQTSAEKKQKIALLLVDLDNFKAINDTYGHSGGDTVLKELARILVATFRKDDYVSRIGGDEFAVVLPDFKMDSTTRIVEKIKIVNEELSHMKDDIHPVSISVGVALSDDGYSQELFDKADKALYAVKSNGRKGCRIYDPKTM
jgi:diguanylate cyclase (GGDEF)-like protein